MIVLKGNLGIYLMDGNIVRFDKKLSYYTGPIGKNQTKTDSVIQSTFTIFKKQITIPDGLRLGSL